MAIRRRLIPQQRRPPQQLPQSTDVHPSSPFLLFAHYLILIAALQTISQSGPFIRAFSPGRDRNQCASIHHTNGTLTIVISFERKPTITAQTHIRPPCNGIWSHSALRRRRP